MLMKVIVASINASVNTRVVQSMRIDDDSVITVDNGGRMRMTQDIIRSGREVTTSPAEDIVGSAGIVTIWQATEHGEVDIDEVVCLTEFEVTSASVGRVALLPELIDA